ncbi:recombinase family protein [Christensenellaceae bacterium OttesenSCG-928-K19]|nr:recombinase family protein [Christensenellaceae bacterium OttesenSCG-928-K19]
MKNKQIYGYARVSTQDQNLDRQIDLLKAYGIPERNILVDKASGKDYDRKAYNTLVGTPDTVSILREGDLLVVVSLDRLGRNYTETKDQWEHITKIIGADVKVLDMPLLDTTASNGNLDSRFIADLVLQILSYTAEKERENIRKRQQQGIEAAKARGKHLGRPKAERPENWNAVCSEWKQGHITARQAMDMLDMKRTTFYKMVGM